MHIRCSTFDNVIKVQNDGVAMGSPLGPTFSDIFMIQLETLLLPKLTDYMQFVEEISR